MPVPNSKSTAPTRAKRASKAQTARRLAALQAQAAVPRELPAEIAALIDEFTDSGLEPNQLTQVRGLIREVITVSEIRGRASAVKHRSHLAALCRYALTRGRPLSVPALMTTEFIDEYIRVGMSGSSDALRAERRRRLLNLAREANPGPNVPQRLAPIPHRAIRPPYTPGELTVIRRVADAQPSPARRRDVCAIVALCAGAGADSVDLRRLRVCDIEDLGVDGWQVAFHDPRPRIVPIRLSYEGLIRVALDGRPGRELALPTSGNRNKASRALEKAVITEGPDIEPSRLRASWLADLMTDPIPIGLILKAAGLESARTLVDLVPHLDPWLTAKGLSGSRQHLRGGAR